MARITALNIYPVKSCRGIALTQARLTATGFTHDREWLIVRPNGQFITQRDQPLLALIETAITADRLVLRRPQGATLSVPLAMTGQSTVRAIGEGIPRETGTEVEVTCWRDRCAAFDAGEEAAGWLTEYLGSPHRLVRFDARRPRPSNPQWTQGIETFNRFTDGFPWLVISEASLEDLNSRLPNPLPMNRFRPNIVVDGLPPYGEDEVHEFVAGEVRLRVAKPCERCVITTTDQATGERAGEEPLRTLKTYRFSRELRGVLFGQNLLLVSGAGAELRVGQDLEVTKQ